jgi:hypothetical protein
MGLAVEVWRVKVWQAHFPCSMWLSLDSMGRVVVSRVVVVAEVKVVALVLGILV